MMSTSSPAHHAADMSIPQVSNTADMCTWIADTDHHIPDATVGAINNRMMKSTCITTAGLGHPGIQVLLRTDASAAQLVAVRENHNPAIG